MEKKMDYEYEKKKLEAQLQAAKQRLEREDAKRRTLKREMLAAASKLNDRAEKWHRYALAYDDRMNGYTGEQALAREVLRNVPFEEYVEQVRKHSNDGALSLVKAELATVIWHMDTLTKTGRKNLLSRDVAVYEKEWSGWQRWCLENPDKNNWRNLKATKGQNMLIGRIVDTKNIEAPPLLNRGDAHDWIARHGGNPRFADNQPIPKQGGEA
jgi:hypothetical protein